MAAPYVSQLDSNNCCTMCFKDKKNIKVPNFFSKKPNKKVVKYIFLSEFANFCLKNLED